MKTLLALNLFILTMMTGCGSDNDNWSAELVAKCSYIPVINVAANYKTQTQTSLTTECRNILEPLLKFDNSSEGGWDRAPLGMKERVIEAFQAIIAYPLALPPENRIFGASPYSIPAWHLSILNSFENYNKSLFNYVLNQVSRIAYSTIQDGTQAAEYGIDTDFRTKITIHPYFWQDATFDYVLGSPFKHAASLIHEARHGDSYFHPLCTGKCDPDLVGPYGMNVTYDELLLHGSAVRGSDGSRPLIGETDTLFIAIDLYGALQSHINTLPPELALIVRSIDLNKFYLKDVIRLENLDR